jgi:hypothetical protein
VNHGDRVALLGRWILDNGHDVEGFYRTEIHPPLLVATAAAEQPPDGSRPRTRVLFMSRPYLGGQTYTNNLDTRDQDGVDDDGSLKEHAIHEVAKVLGFRSTMVELYAKIKEKPFRDNQEAQFIVRPPGPRPGRARLMVSYRFTVRRPCTVFIEPLPGSSDALRITIGLNEEINREQYQSPELPQRHEETYSNDDLDLLSPGAGDRIGFGELLLEIVSIFFGGILYAIYIRIILGRGMKTDIYEPVQEFDILDSAGGVSGVAARDIVPGAGILESDEQPHPVTGWIEAYWAGG